MNLEIQIWFIMEDVQIQIERNDNLHALLLDSLFKAS